MTRNQLLELLQAHGEDHIRDGYNYTAFCIRCSEDLVGEVARRLHQDRTGIEARMGKHIHNWAMHPVVCLSRKRSVLVPTTFNTPLNVLSEVLRVYIPMVRDGVKLPTWS